MATMRVRGSSPVLLLMSLGHGRSFTTRSWGKATEVLEENLRDPSTLFPRQLEELVPENNLFPVFNPADPNAVVAFVVNRGPDDARIAIERANEALPSWRDGTTAMERSLLLTKWSRLLQEYEQDLATIMTLESGKPLAESLGEVAYGRSFLDHFAAEALRNGGAGGGSVIPTAFADPSSGRPRGEMMAIHQAVGVSALITPWNFPLAMITRKAGPALAAGCTAVVKPSELTPLTAVALTNLAHQAGIPSAVMQLVTADQASTPQVGKEFCTNPLVRKLSFTGSTAVGKTLMSWSSQTVQRLSLELGGNAPFVVFEDADLEQAVSAALASKFRNAGQTCVCADRFLVQESIHDAFVELLARRTQELAVGNGLDPGTKIGPLITDVAVSRVRDKVEQALADGATCRLGGPPATYPEGQQFYPPTILTNVSCDSELWKSETFGPAVAIRSFENEAEALAISNRPCVGLAAYFCTKDLSRTFRFAKALECGLVGVNEGIISTCAAPFGGVKESGLGREGGSLGLSEYLETKYIFINT